MPSIFGDRPLRLTPRVLSANTTLTVRDLQGSFNVFLNTGSDAWILTLPSPMKDLSRFPVFVGNPSSGAFTLSCSSGFVGGDSSVVLDAHSWAILWCAPTEETNTTYQWTVLGAPSAITGLSETIADKIGAMVTSNTETGIEVVYQDTDNTLDFTISDEYIQDIVGAMFSGNTETGITATYQDADGTIDLVVDTSTMSFTYVKTGLTGGTASDLDGIDGDTLSDGDTALVVVGNAPGICYIYVLDDDGAAGESSPSVIVPDSNPGTKNWVLASIKTLSTDVTDWQEAVEDTTGAMLGTASTHLGNTVTYTDGSGTCAIDSDSFQYSATALTGGGAGALDAIDGAAITDGQRAIVTVGVNPGICYLYIWDDDNAGSESSPDIIAADANGGDGRWVLAQMHVANLTDWAAWSASAVWSGGAPASVTEVYRYRRIGDTVEFKADLSGSDGDAKTLTSFTLPVTPADVNMQIACAGYQLIDSTWTQVFAYVDAEDGTPANRIVKFRNSLECTDGAAFRIIVSGSYEV